MSYFKSTSITELQKGLYADIGPNHELLTETPVRLVGVSFIGSTLDTNFWTETDANGGTVTIANNQALLKTSAAVNGSSIIQSVRLGRYIPGVSNKYRSLIQLGDTGTVGNIRRWGAFDANNGCFLQLSGTTFSVVTRKTGSDTPVNNGSFNGNYGITYSGIDTNAHTYEIFYNNKYLYFMIDQILVHKITASAATWTDVCTLPSRTENTKTSGASDISIAVRSSTIYRLGYLQTQTIYKYVHGAFSGALKLGAGRLHKVVMNNTTGTSLTLFDNTTNASPTIAIIATTQMATLDYDLPFFTGLYAVGVGGTLDCTIVYE